MKCLSLFSGIGGLDLAAEWAGIMPVAFCEIEEYPVKILNRRWPNVQVFGDVATLTADSLGERGIGTNGIDLIIGGFPCQPFSVAGKRRGKKDERFLWGEFARLISEIRPRWVVAENVPGLISIALDDVLSDLERQNYTAGTFVFPASAVGAPHRRERLFIVAHAGGERLERCKLERAFNEIAKRRKSAHVATSECCEGGRMWATPTACGNYNKVGASKSLGNGLATSVKNWPTPKAGKPEGYSSGGFRPTLAQQVTGEPKPKHGQLNPDWVEMLMGFPCGWTNVDCDDPTPWPGWPAGLGTQQYPYEPPRTVFKMPNRAKRLKALGNAVVPQQAFPIFRAIAEIERSITNE